VAVTIESMARRVAGAALARSTDNRKAPSP
jgi:hypothetical protein